VRPPFTEPDVPFTPAAIDPKRALHAIDYKHPPHLSFPIPIELGLARLREAAENPRSAWAQRLRAALGRWRYGAQGGGRKERQRAPRSDGFRNTLALLASALASADVGSLLLALPTGKERPTAWAHRRLDELGFFAYGPAIPEVRSTRREERAWRRSADAMLLGGIERWEQRANGDYRAKVSIKRIGAALIDLLDLRAALDRARREAQKKKADQQKRMIESLIASTSKPVGKQAVAASQRPQETPQVPAAVESGPEPPAPPEPRRGASEHAQRMQEEIAAMLAKMN
jgi:hypothetical protein